MSGSETCWTCVYTNRLVAKETLILLRLLPKKHIEQQLRPRVRPSRRMLCLVETLSSDHDSRVRQRECYQYLPKA
jgi:hypothetical protein